MVEDNSRSDNKVQTLEMSAFNPLWWPNLIMAAALLNAEKLAAKNYEDWESLIEMFHLFQGNWRHNLRKDNLIL